VTDALNGLLANMAVCKLDLKDIEVLHCRVQRDAKPLL
jgi:hypothetical protein